jgi:hypothetical protein
MGGQRSTNQMLAAYLVGLHRMVVICLAARASHTVCNVAQGLDRLDVEHGEAHEDDDKEVDDKLPRVAVQRFI